MLTGTKRKKPGLGGAWLKSKEELNKASFREQPNRSIIGRRRITDCLT